MNSSPKLRTALALFPARHSIAEMMPVIKELIRRGWKVNAVLGWMGPDVSSILEYLRSESVHVIAPPQDLVYGAESEDAEVQAALPHEQALSADARADRRQGGQTLYLRRLLLGLAERSKSFGQLLAAIGHFRLIRARKRAAAEIFEQTRPNLFVAGNFHSCGRLEGALLRVCLKNAVTSVCILASQLVSREIIRRGRHTQFSMGMIGQQHDVGYSFLNGLLTALWPAAASTQGDRRLLMWTPDVLLPALILRQADADPFQVPSPEFERVFAPTDSAVRLLLIGEYPQDKIRMFGIPRLDEAVRIANSPELRRALRARLGIGPDAPYVLWNIEPSWEHRYCDAPTHWSRVRDIAAVLGRMNFRTVVSLHPLCEPTDYFFLNSEFGIIVDSREGIANLYPDAAFVVSFPCSTNGFAPTFGKEILVYDWFGVRRDSWRHQVYAQESAYFVESMSEFAEVLRILEDRHSATSIAVASQTVATSASSRIVDDIETLLESR